MKGLIGKKIGMTSIFTETGDLVPVTVIHAGPNYITQVKTEETDGYNAFQLGYGNRKEKRTTSALKGHFDKAGVSPASKMAEFRDVRTGYVEASVGDEVSVDIFTEGEFVNVTGTSKGKGFQGVVKRHGFGGVGMRTHGQHNRERAPGSIGAASYPARVFKNGWKASENGKPTCSKGRCGKEFDFC